MNRSHFVELVHVFVALLLLLLTVGTVSNILLSAKQSVRKTRTDQISFRILPINPKRVDVPPKQLHRLLRPRMVAGLSDDSLLDLDEAGDDDEGLTFRPKVSHLLQTCRQNKCID